VKFDLNGVLLVNADPYVERGGGRGKESRESEATASASQQTP
jgi:hypothetical protein